MTLRNHLQYASYVLRHKWYVLRECWKAGLYRRGVTHDWHKLLPDEWWPYVGCFYGGRGEDLAFRQAWRRHQHRGDHHWQHWLLLDDDHEGKHAALPMPPEVWLEMLCDWCGASKARGKGGWPEVLQWYEDHRGKICLHPETRQHVETYLTAMAAKAF